MKGTTHLLFALLLGFLYIKRALLPAGRMYLFFLFLVVGATLPDIDQKLKFLKHRGTSHSLIFPVLAFLLGMTYFPLFGLALGLISHDALDALTPSGWKPLSFLKFKIREPIKTGGVAELLLSGLFAFLIFYLLTV